MREDRIDDASYWREPFTELPAYVEGDLDGGDARGSAIWDNRHILAQVLDVCQCSINSVSEFGAPGSNNCLGRVISGVLSRDLNYQNAISRCQAPDADYSFFGPYLADLYADGPGYGCDIFNDPNCLPYGTYLDDCRLEPLGHLQTDHNGGN